MHNGIFQQFRFSGTAVTRIVKVPDGKPSRYAPSNAATMRFGAFPTFTRFTSRRVRTSIIDTSSVPVLLTHTYLPSGENVTQFGPSPTCTRPVILFAFTS